MKRNIFVLSLLSLSIGAYAQEVLSELKFNPQLYYKYKDVGDNRGKRLINNGEIFEVLPDTQSLPFIDDFSKYHLEPYDLDARPVAYRFNRSINAANGNMNFRFMEDTSWSYSFNTTTRTVDSMPKQKIQLILNNDPNNQFIVTDTIFGWPDYYNNYSFDSSNGAAKDSSYVEPDSIIKYFIYNYVIDSNALWLDNYAYINDEYPINKLSYGVATFDGLNQYGLPHNNNSIEVYGPADTLTSQPINLLGLDTQNVYLSFVYQPQGLGYKPEVEDSLILEFKLIGSTWVQIWAVPGSDSIIDNPEFKYVLIPLTNPFYFNEAFQFRFRNKATISGNNDHWHLDYVYLNENRSEVDTVVTDLAVLGPATSFLKNYRSMPWDHFEGYETTETVQNITLLYRNNYAIQRSIDNISYSARDVYSDSVLYQYPLGRSKNVPPFSPQPDDIYLVSDFIPYTPITSDSVLFDLITTFSDINPTSITTENDTVSSPVLFKNYFAYDDGTAERAYGLEPQPLLKLAYEFHLNHPDTLRAIEIYFAQVSDNLLLRQFTLMVWSNIDSNNTLSGDDTLYARPRTPFFYNPERNGFVTYRLDPPLVLDATVLSPDLKFYIGWQQLFSENTQVGTDLNNSAAQHTFYYSEGKWKKSRLEGALMIRPIVGKYVEIFGTGTEEHIVGTADILLYPNPAEDFIYMNVPKAIQMIYIYDMQGGLLKSSLISQERIDISDLNSGLYLLRGVSNDKTWTRKFVKQ